jgi:dipeptidyl aminopeptidase/acylaminoacyl peptidase
LKNRTLWFLSRTVIFEAACRHGVVAVYCRHSCAWRIQMQRVTVWSEGTRLAATLFRPPDMQGDERRPAVLLCHGWGGVQAGLVPYAEAFAAAGYVAMTFDYRGIGESDGKVVVLDSLPKEATEATVRVQVIRDLVDPFDWAWDVRHCLDYLEGEPGVDTSRIGLWGTSFGGGVALWTAVHDERVQCVVTQVAAHDARPLDDPEQRQGFRERAIRQARGEDPPVPQGTDSVPGLRGTPHFAKFAAWAPVEYSEQVRVPVLLVDAEQEALFDRTRNSGRVYERMRAAGNAPVEYYVVPGIPHFEIYRSARQDVLGRAIAWLDRYLKPAG